jgi:hypothetical protein
MRFKVVGSQLNGKADSSASQTLVGPKRKGPLASVVAKVVIDIQSNIDVALLQLLKQPRR